MLARINLPLKLNIDLPLSLEVRFEIGPSEVAGALAIIGALSSDEEEQQRLLGFAQLLLGISDSPDGTDETQSPAPAPDGTSSTDDPTARAEDPLGSGLPG